VRNLFPALAAIIFFGCSSAPPPPPPNVSATKAAMPVKPLHFIENDLAGAIAKARAEKKAVFIDAWAPWCHTCLSMQNFVLNDHALRPFASQVVFVAIDTDRQDSAPFLERYHVKSWPTFFVIDPASERVAGYWAGSASVQEMRGFIEEALREIAGGEPDPASRAFAEARAAHAAGKLEPAAELYSKALSAAQPSWPNRSAAIVGLLHVLRGAKSWEACVKAGTEHLEEVTGTSMPADSAALLLSCAEELPPGGEKRAKAESIAIKRIVQITEQPPEGATVDDRADALAILADALLSMKDEKGARKAQETRLALMEEAARKAPSPEKAHTFDYGRANAYLALGRADEAIRMLEQREKELPAAYEPPARLASMLFRTDKLPEALAAVDRALVRAYGPRRLNYLKLRADILQKMGNRDEELLALRQEVRGYELLPPGQSSPERLAGARRRLQEAERRPPPQKPAVDKAPGKPAAPDKAPPGKPAAPDKAPPGKPAAPDKAPPAKAPAKAPG
jgi:tetratricopeptide (TPR) repeat protein